MALAVIVPAGASSVSTWWLVQHHDVELAPPRAPVVRAEPATPSLTVTNAPPALPPPATATPAPVRYRVRSGDNLTAVSAYFGARLEDVIKANALPDSGSIMAGQELIIPRAP